MTSTNLNKVRLRKISWEGESLAQRQMQQGIYLNYYTTHIRC
jgi:hypothetical protein